MAKYTKEEYDLIDRGVAKIGEQYSYTSEQREQSYVQWIKGGSGWDCGQGGTGVMRMLMWYHHTYKPGSNEWRPKIIIKALIDNEKENTVHA